MRFTCEDCGLVFESEATREELIPDEVDFKVVCDDCYVAIDFCTDEDAEVECDIFGGELDGTKMNIHTYTSSIKIEFCDLPPAMGGKKYRAIYHRNGLNSFQFTRIEKV